jgi:SPP1 family predicted phage head-tail adaptor
MADQIGRFKDRVTFLKLGNSGATDEDGVPIKDFVPVYTCRCQVITMQGSEYFQASAVQAVNHIRFIIRYTKNIEFTSNMRVDYDGQIYEVIADPTNDNGLNKTITVICRRLSRG